MLLKTSTRGGDSHPSNDRQKAGGLPWLCTLLLLAVTASLGFSASFKLPGARYMSGRFAFHVAPGGTETLYMLDLGGDTLASQPLADHMPRIGPGYDAPFYALVDKHIVSQERRVSVVASTPVPPPPGR